MSIKQSKIAIPLLLHKMKEVQREWERAVKVGDLVEIWCDRIQDLDLKKLLEKKSCPVIINCKGPKEKGIFKGSEKERVQILIEAAQGGADFVDIGWHTNKKLLIELLKNKGKAKIIISHHNFEKTPSLATLEKLAQKISVAGADMIKIITTAQKNEDNLILFELNQRLAKKKKEFLVFAMGPRGKISRLICPLLGTAWMFAPLDTRSASAPGQVPVEHLRQFWQAVGVE